MGELDEGQHMNGKNYFDAQDLCIVTNDTLAIKYPREHDQIPTIRKQLINLNDFQYLSFQNIRQNDERKADEKTVGFFIKDIKFECVCRKPWRYVERLGQYRQVMSPDVSCYTDMPLADQRFSVYLNRIIGEYWQSA